MSRSCPARALVARRTSHERCPVRLAGAPAPDIVACHAGPDAPAAAGVPRRGGPRHRALRYRRAAVAVHPPPRARDILAAVTDSPHGCGTRAHAPPRRALTGDTLQSIFNRIFRYFLTALARQMIAYVAPPRRATVSCLQCCRSGGVVGSLDRARRHRVGYSSGTHGSILSHHTSERSPRALPTRAASACCCARPGSGASIDDT